MMRTGMEFVTLGPPDPNLALRLRSEVSKVSNDLQCTLAQLVVLIVAQGLRRCDHNGFTSVDTHWIEILHVANRDAIVVFIPHHFVLQLLPTLPWMRPRPTMYINKNGASGNATSLKQHFSIWATAFACKKHDKGLISEIQGLVNDDLRTVDQSHAHQFPQVLLIVCEATAQASQCIGCPDEHRVSNVFGLGFSVVLFCLHFLMASSTMAST